MCYLLSLYPSLTVCFAYATQADWNCASASWVRAAPSPGVSSQTFIDSRRYALPKFVYLFVSRRWWIRPHQRQPLLRAPVHHVELPERYGGAVLLPVFRHGLTPELQLELACRDADRGNFPHDHSRPTPERKPMTTQCIQEPMFNLEPMQIGSSRLSAEERCRRVERGLCLYCGGGGHYRFTCPIRQRKEKVTPALLRTISFICPLLCVCLTTPFLCLL